MSFSVIVTIGPSILDSKKINAINSLGNCIYRLNGAHVNGQQTREMAGTIRSFVPDAKIMIDLPGNKVRTQNLSEPIRLIKGESFFLADYNLNYSQFGNHLKKGDLIHANDSIYTLEVD